MAVSEITKLYIIATISLQILYVCNLILLDAIHNKIHYYYGYLNNIVSMLFMLLIKEF